MLAARSFNRFVRIGRLTIIDADGHRHSFEGRPGPSATIRLKDRALHHRLFFSPHLAIGEGYMDGRLVLEDGTGLYEFLDLCMANLDRSHSESLQWLFSVHRRFRAAFRHWNPVRLAQRKVSHHYDLSDSLFDQFLDRDRQYSCAYFLSPADDLATAQHNKKVHLIAKLLIEPGQRILDIGSGWGGLALTLAAQHRDIRVDGVTLSTEQHRVSNRRAEAAGVADRVRFHLLDYRLLEERFDRIVSVGMLEHVGPRHYREFYSKIAALLDTGGLAMVHSVGVFRNPGPLNPWIDRYIFPGAYTPSLSQQTRAIEHAGMLTTDLEILRTHYADTLLAWRRRCEAAKTVIEAMYDARFYRMWQMYLTGCEAAFRRGILMVFQIQLAKDLDTVPQTRDYIHDYEHRHFRRPERALQEVGD